MFYYHQLDVDFFPQNYPHPTTKKESTSKGIYQTNPLIVPSENDNWRSSRQPKKTSEIRSQNKNRPYSRIGGVDHQARRRRNTRTHIIVSDSAGESHRSHHHVNEGCQQRRHRRTIDNRQSLRPYRSNRSSCLVQTHR